MKKMQKKPVPKMGVGYQEGFCLDPGAKKKKKLEKIGIPKSVGDGDGGGEEVKES